jgi:hypothetical protein
LGTYAGERPRVHVSARAQVRPGRTGSRPGGGVCGQVIGGTDMVTAQRRRHAHGKGQRWADGERGSAHDEGLCSHDSWPKKGRALARRRVLSVWVPAANRSSATHVEQRNDTTARQRSTRGDDGSGTCMRPARLDGRLSSDGGSARRRDVGQRATYKQRAHMAQSSLGLKAGSTTR